MNVVIIGGVAGGAGTATRIKRLCESARVLVIEKGEFVSFANCGLPYHIGGVIAKRSHLLLQTPESLHKRSGLEVRTLHEALKILPEQKKVEIKDLKSGVVYTEPYDTLVIASGSRPIAPLIEGIKDPAVKTLWTISDMDGILHSLNGASKKTAVIGGGFVGLETAENLAKAGHSVALIEKFPHVLPSLDGEMAAYLEEELTKRGVSLHLGQGLRKIERRGESLFLHLDSGEILETGLVILAAGVAPNSALARDAGLKLNERGGIIVNEYLQTSDPHIYAVGDVIETYNIATENRGMIPLAGPASRQARIAAENITGRKKAYRGINPTSVCKVFSLAAASTGANEKQLEGKTYHKIYVHPFNHTTYYPGAEQMHIKLLYGEDGSVLGAQIVGGEGTDKRIDIFSIAVRQNLSVYDLAEQDLAYAPPFGAPRDPIHAAAFAAINQLEGLSKPIFSSALPETLLDVREPAEVSAMPLQNAVAIPLGELRARLGELDKNIPLTVVCASGLRSYLAERILVQNGFKARNFSGGYASLRMTLPRP